MTPTTIAVSTTRIRGNVSPRENTRARAIAPAEKLLTDTIANGSFPAIFRVGLLSIPQKMQARTTPAAPIESPAPSPGFHVSRILAPVITASADQTLRPTFSRKRATASIVVATASKFRSSRCRCCRRDSETLHEEERRDDSPGGNCQNEPGGIMPVNALLSGRTRHEGPQEDPEKTYTESCSQVQESNQEQWRDLPDKDLQEGGYSPRTEPLRRQRMPAGITSLSFHLPWQVFGIAWFHVTYDRE